MHPIISGLKLIGALETTIFTKAGMGKRVHTLPIVSLCSRPLTTINRRFFSLPLSGPIRTDTAPLLQLCQQSNTETVRSIANAQMNQLLLALNGSNPSGDFEDRWNSLGTILRDKYRYSLPPLNGKEPEAPDIEALFNVIKPDLMINGQKTSTYTLSDYIRTISEFYWFQYPPTIPFTR